MTPGLIFGGLVHDRAVISRQIAGLARVREEGVIYLKDQRVIAVHQAMVCLVMANVADGGPLGPYGPAQVNLGELTRMLIKAVRPRLVWPKDAVRAYLKALVYMGLVELVDGDVGHAGAVYVMADLGDEIDRGWCLNMTRLYNEMVMTELIEADRLMTSAGRRSSRRGKGPMNGVKKNR